MLIRLVTLLLGLSLSIAAIGDSYLDALKPGNVKLQQAGSLAFAPEGILLIGDSMAATIYAVDTGDRGSHAGEINLADVDGHVAAALGTTRDRILIHDMVANPLSGNAYLSVSRGKGPESPSLIMRVDANGQVSELVLDNVRYASAMLPNAPDPGSKNRWGQSNRLVSITDIGYLDGRVIVAGLANEEFASTLRTIEFPFTAAASGTSIEIYHGNHGRWETRAPVRAFTTMMINNEPYVVAAYTCTPLVLFPLSALKEGEKLNGVTVAELGNRNRPLDMFVYQKDGKEFLLMANNARGTMKISTENMGTAKPIESKIGGIAGQQYETIEDLGDVIQLDRFQESSALVIVARNNSMDLKTIPLP